MNMSCSKENNYRIVDGGKYECLICNKNLSTKQRVLTHLASNRHRFSPLKRTTKRYVDDESVPVPRTTLWRQKTRRKLIENHDINIKVQGNILTENDDKDQAKVPVCKTSGSKINMFTGIRLDEPQYGIEQGAVEESSTSDIASTPSLLPLSVSHPSSSHLDSESCLSIVDDPMQIENGSSDYSSDNQTLPSDDNESTASSVYSASFSDSESSDIDAATSDNDFEDEHDIKNSNLSKTEHQAFSLLSCFIRNKFSASACKDVIQTLKTTFPDSEMAKLDYNEILSHIDLSPVHEIHYCKKCLDIFPEDKDIFQCQNPSCDGLRYKGPLAAQTKKFRQPQQSFVFTDMKSQLIALLETPGIWKNIQDTKEAAFERFESGSTILTDILDGSAYRSMMRDSYLKKSSNNLTGVFNTDGINLFSSSKIELWPIYLAINEMSPQKRFNRENIIFVGIWQGKGKPPMNQFLGVFVQLFDSLYIDGVEIQVDGQLINVKLSVLCCVADLPAKAEILNMSYFNGPHACIKCEEPGKSVKQGGGTAKCYPYKVQGTRSSQRTQESVLHNMRSGSNRSRSKGFKGTSSLLNLQNYNIVTGTVPEYMHCVLLGVTKTLMTKWFSSVNSKKDYFIGNHLKEISNRMSNLKPAENIERLPRDLEKHYNHFKATELQSWLLYYAFPCVKDFLKDDYLENFSYLSEAIHILLRDAISQEMLVDATELLDQFYGSFQRLYCDGSCGLNVHNTGYHLTEYVKLLGPLWAWSAFPFEDANAILLQAVHGTGTVMKQMMKFRQIQSGIRRKGLDLKTTDSRKITYNTLNCDVAGAAKSLKPEQIRNEVRQYIEMVHGAAELKKVDRIIVGGKRFYSKQYTRMKKRICSVVLYRNDEVGTIKYFILCNNIVYAVIQKMKQIPNMQIPGIRIARRYTAVEFTEHVSIIDVSDLKEVLVYLDTRDDENVQRNAANYAQVVRMPIKFGHAVFK